MRAARSRSAHRPGCGCGTARTVAAAHRTARSCGWRAPICRARSKRAPHRRPAARPPRRPGGDRGPGHLCLDGSGIAHDRRTGRLRTDNPLSSALQLTDEPVTVYDLVRLTTSPPLMVLSACDSALADVRPGDEQLGLASALLGLGASSRVGAVLPVGDAVTSALMTVFHQHLRAGRNPPPRSPGREPSYPGKRPRTRRIPPPQPLKFYNNGASIDVVVD
ncbi:CHAT domain-containing protein [Pseudonocardia thermophila]|uniref:CHAT domain-containing protein n=1 Tax=Pseudonocardia thermophila TaxID=1848 RepID=UPI0031E8CA2D